MQVTVTGRKMEITDALNNHVQEKIMGVKKFMDEVKDVHVVLSVEKYRHFAEITLNASGYVIHCKEETNDMYSTIDRVVGKMTKQLKKHKDKIATLKNKKRFEEEDPSSFQSGTLSPDMEAPIKETPHVVKVEKSDSKPMFLEEASMQLQATKNNFLVFRNASNGNVNVLYHRSDGNLGLIETE